MTTNSGAEQNETARLNELAYYQILDSGKERNVHGFALMVCILFYAFIAIPKHTLTYLLKGKFDMLKAFYKGITWNLTHYNIYHNESLT